jgi:predicted GNAT superfamily acetyltransferase
MAEPELEIRTLDTAADMASVVTVFQQVWGSVTPIVGVELLTAIAHSGGYVAAAFESGNIIGASFGFLARHQPSGRPTTDALHSHVTGILPGVQHSGVGRAMKNHQRTWAAERDIPWITWTFDPLVRRNAWFNIEVLHCHVVEYIVNFYGEMTDSINGNDESDRLVAAWPTDPSTPGPEAPSGGARIEVPTPDDIVALRRTDPGEAAEWRQRVRSELGNRLSSGGVVTGFTRDGSYVVDAAP